MNKLIYLVKNKKEFEIYINSKLILFLFLNVDI